MHDEVEKISFNFLYKFESDFFRKYIPTQVFFFSKKNDSKYFLNSDINIYLTKINIQFISYYSNQITPH